MVSVEQIVGAGLGYASVFILDEVKEGPAGEVAHRDLARMLYYLCFHVAKEYVLKNDRTKDPGISHDELWKWFKKREGLGTIGNKGDQLKLVRQHADYKLDRDFKFERYKMLSEVFTIIGKLNQPLFDKYVKRLDFGPEFKYLKEQPRLPNT